MNRLDIRFIGDADKLDGKKASDFANVDLSNITSLGKILDLDGNGSGLDADLVRGLPADFTGSLSGAGYQKLPSGLIIQWGSTVVTNTAGTGNYAVTITFPIAFPNECLSVALCAIGGDDISLNYWATTQIQAISATSFKGIVYKGTSDGSWGIYWIAIGY